MAQPGPVGPAFGSAAGPYPSVSPYGASPVAPYPRGYMGSAAGPAPVPSTRFGPYAGSSRVPSYGPTGPSTAGVNYGPPIMTEGERSPRIAFTPQPLLQEGIRSRAPELPQSSPELSPQDRMKIPLIDYKYRQGLNNYNDGNSSRDEYKMRMGIQQMDDANENIGRLKSEAPQGIKGQDNRGGGRGQRSR